MLPVHKNHEGHSFNVDNAIYNVQTTRLLNPSDREDEHYLLGQPKPKPGHTYLGVFLRIKNESNKPYLPPREMEIVDTDGNSYKALDASTSSFALNFSRPVPQGGEEPEPDTPAKNGVAGGSLVLFLIRNSSIKLRPMELEIPAFDGKKVRAILDI